MNVEFTIPIWIYWIVYTALVAWIVPGIVGFVVYVFAVGGYGRDRAIAVGIGLFVVALAVAGFIFGLRHSS
jgi:hypothetical protein